MDPLHVYNPLVKKKKHFHVLANSSEESDLNTVEKLITIRKEIYPKATAYVLCVLLPKYFLLYIKKTEDVFSLLLFFFSV